MKNILLILPLLAFGCARFSTTQTDYSYDTKGTPSRKITTKASATTFFDATSALAKFKASQTDKNQTATVGGLDQSVTSTNLSGIFEAVGRGVVQGLK